MACTGTVRLLCCWPQQRYLISAFHVLQPQDAYGLEKLASEELAKHYDTDFGIECRVARYVDYHSSSAILELAFSRNSIAKQLNKRLMNFGLLVFEAGSEGLHLHVSTLSTTRLYVLLCLKSHSICAASQYGSVLALDQLTISHTLIQ